MGSFLPRSGGCGLCHRVGFGEALAPKRHHLQMVRFGLSLVHSDLGTPGRWRLVLLPPEQPWFSVLLPSLLLPALYTFRCSVCAADYLFHYLLVIVLSSLILCSPVMSVQSVLLSSDMSYVPFEPRLIKHSSFFK